MLRVIETFNGVPCFSKQMRMSALSAGYIEKARTCRQTKEIDQPRNFLPVAREGKDRLVFEQIMGVEIRLPPLAFLQKKTGSR
ncbi:MAG TPA: hypothetical protein VF042_08135 [Gemmatimonadaceae bacterium]